MTEEKYTPQYGKLPLATVLIVLVVMVGLFILPYFLGTFAPGDDTDNTPISQDLEVVVADSYETLDFFAKKFEYPQDWAVAGMLESTVGTDYLCSTSHCEIVLLNNEGAEAKLTQLAISSPGSVQLPNTSELDTIVKDLIVDGVSVSMVFEIQDTVSFDQEGNEIEPATVYSQVYGCTSDDICILAGPLSLNLETNESQVAELEGFLSEVHF